jgi:hypothetical protein
MPFKVFARDCYRATKIDLGQQRIDLPRTILTRRNRKADAWSWEN